ncbi:hypothetical protein [Streptomyces xiaopingdaonensis]|uniref:hypothetical protein n=1 Tax=Streptomyces xiaopingdaonensis TaxID=1565415 RepID=UPI000377957C|nr:hypothetical protein [Streptomyces xiaopingdaonensis]
MATDTTKTDNEKTGTEPETTEEEAKKTEAAEQTADSEETPEDARDDAPADGEATELPVAKSGGLAAGAGAVVSAGLGLASITGTSLSEMFRERKQLLGQIEAGSGGAGDQVNALYGAPWHATAMINSIFALVAVLLGGLLVLQLSGRTDTRPWVRAVALGGAILGAIGLLTGLGMYFDLFASQPELPGVGG